MVDRLPLPKGACAVTGRDTHWRVLLRVVTFLKQKTLGGSNPLTSASWWQGPGLTLLELLALLFSFTGWGLLRGLLTSSVLRNDLPAHPGAGQLLTQVPSVQFMLGACVSTWISCPNIKQVHSIRLTCAGRKLNAGNEPVAN